MAITRRTIGIVITVVMSWYFQYGDKDPFCGKSNAERLSLWGSDKIGEMIDASCERERAAEQIRNAGRGR